ncbi:hypothetical protein N9B73_12895, partial [Verrucomicrobiales bacterium]|nr:hypothetical protein [Verrucomicrobiales bacterium]
LDPVQTNMVFVSLPKEQREDLIRFFEAKGIQIGGYVEGKLRIVTHLDVSFSDIDEVISTFREWAG